MKKDLFTLICMVLVCATVMLGVMGIYRLLGESKTDGTIIPTAKSSTLAFKAKSFGALS